ncbi:MAG: gamma-glutamylcyclotransferase [Syntrophobacteraceae bacterium]|nr:gamma-glutamylcyclotransferase [Syntrophobacteraceae bacterium]
MFVYGTLRRGFENHFLLDGAIFLGPARTRGKYALFSENIPYVSKTKEISTVAGEVYRVDSPTLERIDLLEGHPNWYVREMIEVVLQDGSIVSAWIYFCPAPEGILVESGDYGDVVPIQGERDV